MKSLARRLLCALLMVAQCALPVWAAPLYDTASTDESRLALVIGNSAYLVDPLDNPVNDANVVARSLERLGFEVMLAINLPGAELKRRVRTFQARARAERGTALVYYAGHAVAPAGRNILLPVDINFRDVLEVEDEGIDVAKMLAILEDSKKHTRIMIFDACRDNPYGQVGEALIRTTARARGIGGGGARANASDATGGLAAMAGKGTLVAYSTAPGAVAEDGDGRSNSVFTAELVDALAQPGLTAQQVFSRVAERVRKETRGQQVPWVSGALDRSFVFSAARVEPASLVVPGERREQTEVQLRTEMNRLKRLQQNEKVAAQQVAVTLLERERVATELDEAAQRLRLAAQAEAKALADAARAQAEAAQRAAAEAREAARRQAAEEQARLDRLAQAAREAEAREQAARQALAAQRERDLAERQQAEQARLALLAEASRPDGVATLPAAPIAVRRDNDGNLLVRGVRLPADLRVRDLPAGVPPACAAFYGAWGRARWEGQRSAEVWVENVTPACDATVVYARGGDSVDRDEPAFERHTVRAQRDELRLRLRGGAELTLRATADRTLAATWSRGSVVANVEFERIASDPLASQAFALEDRDDGVRPPSVITARNYSRRLPVAAPGAATISTAQLLRMLGEAQPPRLIDARAGAAKPRINGAVWLPELGAEQRLGAVERGAIEAALSKLAGSDRNVPMVVFDRSVDWGWIGYHAVLRLREMGYSNLYWYRGGSDAWHDAGLPLVAATSPAR